MRRVRAGRTHFLFRLPPDTSIAPKFHTIWVASTASVPVSHVCEIERTNGSVRAILFRSVRARGLNLPTWRRREHDNERGRGGVGRNGGGDDRWLGSICCMLGSSRVINGPWIAQQKHILRAKTTGETRFALSALERATIERDTHRSVCVMRRPLARGDNGLFMKVKYP